MNSISTLRKTIGFHPLVPRGFRIYNGRNFEQIPQLCRLGADQLFDIQVVSSVLPFRVNNYVVDELIDWDNIPDDPIFQLVFPQRDMLLPADYARMAALHREGADGALISAAANEIRERLNPHPAGQLDLNRAVLDDERLDGLQHKYRETVLFFPTQGQTCHSYCTFCFRWAQFIGDKELRIASSEATSLHRYLRTKPEVSDLLMTGGDPMVMKTKILAQYLEPLLRPEFEHIQTVRIGTKSLSFWPYRFVTDPDADALLRLLERLVAAGKHVAIMAHYNHWRELDTPIAEEAIRRLRATGAEIRSQGPLMGHINDDAAVWARMWKEQVRLGIIPYYMFIARDTGARHYFEVPLARAWNIYRDAVKQVSGLCRTARGPSMSAAQGKVEIQGVAEIHGEKVFVLRFIQGRSAEWVQRPFFARYDESAVWLDELEPLVGEDSFFFEEEFRTMR